ncbi:MAG: hypothetical protein ACE5FD_14800 [Anaerolineae bacterium]
MTTFTKHTPKISKIKNWRNRPIHLSLIIGTALSGLFSLGWTRITGISAVAMWLLGFSMGFLLMSWFHLRRQRLTAWGLAVAGQLLGVMGISLLLIASLKF